MTNFIRYDRSLDELKRLYEMPLLELISEAHKVHSLCHKAAEIQVCSLISVKTGGCSEDCKYCAQSSRYKTSVTAEPMMSYEAVLEAAKRAVGEGATRVCLGAAWKKARDSRQFDEILRMVKGIAEMGVEVCCTLGMLDEGQARRLKEAGLYAYNHNLDSSEKFYKTIITTRSYQERLATLDVVEKAELSVCCGGIVGMGEEPEDRLEWLLTLSRRNPHPDSVPINRLTRIPGTPLENQPPLSTWEMVRLIAVTRIVLPRAMIRLSSGRREMSFEEQALCFLAGANSIFAGEKLLTVANTPVDRDKEMFELLGLTKRKQAGNLRRLEKPLPLIDFASNDTLGLAKSPLLKQAVMEEISKFEGIGSTGSRLLTGNSAYAEDLEASIARFHGYEAALLFNCGYMANMGLLSAVADSRDTILFDAAIHASARDGIKLSRAKALPFRHNDLEHLEQRLKNSAGGKCFVCIESIYSTDGSKAPLAEISRLADEYGARLIVDEAHAVGVYGLEGRGLAPPVFAKIVTFGKALGVFGACVLGSHQLKEALINFANPMIYTTALPFPVLAGIKCSYELFPKMNNERKHLLSLSPTGTHILALPVEGNREAKERSKLLKEKGFDVRPLLSPTVRKGQEILRVCLHAYNTKDELDELFSSWNRN